ncbi:hypothetical protein TNIN_403721 [Trichonephila inaurata madagascariensis]|uniref:Uncharacterized protein n=1 Tax=Trichonephila inaurata madagascariensis TaxID=2747483 RepID=A0A8X6X3L4_9ARAC|nr:hypothetical protein TNIN_403721 [Trichonephila inaurata madagascariensis]
MNMPRSLNLRMDKVTPNLKEIPQPFTPNCYGEDNQEIYLHFKIPSLIKSSQESATNGILHGMNPPLDRELRCPLSRGGPKKNYGGFKSRKCRIFNGV